MISLMDYSTESWENSTLSGNRTEKNEVDKGSGGGKLTETRLSQTIH